MGDEAESYGDEIKRDLSWPPESGGLDLSKLPDESTGDPDVSRRSDVPTYEKNDYGVRMTEGLANAVQSVMDMGYDEFSSEKGGEAIQQALDEAEEAPEATILEESLRQWRTG